jgi:hypothetical protein
LGKEAAGLTEFPCAVGFDLGVHRVGGEVYGAGSSYGAVFDVNLRENRFVFQFLKNASYDATRAERSTMPVVPSANLTSL